MKSHRRLAAAVAACLAAAALLGPAPTPAAAAPAAFTLRYSAVGWGDVAQSGAAVLECPADATTAAACQDGSDPSIPTGWVDVDKDPSTMNSSRANVVLPARASVDWVGLYWAGDRGTRSADVPARCAGAGETAEPATPAPAPDKANQVKVGIGDGPYTVIPAGSFSSVTAPDGGTGFQAYADITTLIRPPAGATPPAEITLTVADVQAAKGPACVGGWTVMLAYSYGDGPDKNNAPTYRSITIFDGIVPAAAGEPTDIPLTGLVMPAQGDVQPRLTMAFLASAQALGSDSITVGNATVPRSGNGVTAITGLPGPGYQRATSPVTNSGIQPGATAATVRLNPVRSGFVGAVLGVSTPLNARVALSVATSIAPATATVGDEATLTLTVRNDSDLTASGVEVTAHLPDGLALAAETPNFDSGTRKWSVGKVSAKASTSLDLQVRVEAPGGLVASAEVTASDIPATAGDTKAKTSQVTLTAVAAPTAEPSRTPAQASVNPAGAWEWPTLMPMALFGIGLFLLGVLLLGVVLIRRHADTHHYS